jgi:hypothetical protein
MKKLSRRALLRGAGGAAISLPFLEAMLGRNRSVAQPPEIPTRVIFFFTSCGVVPETWWPTSGGETGFVLPTALAPLEPHRSKILIPDGIRMETARADRVSQNGHDKGTVHCLTARTAVEGPSGVGEFGHLWDGTAGGISIDQHIANHFEGVTPYRSLEFGVKAEGISQALPSRISYRGTGEPVIPMNDAGAAFDRIFAPLSGGAEAAAARQRRRELVLGTVRGDLTSLRGRLGTDDRRRIDAHLASIEEVQRQLGDLAAAVCEPPARGSSTEYTMLGRLQMDLMVQAMKCDLTRVASIQWSTGQSGVRMSWLGHGAGHHGVSHEVGSEPSDWDAGKSWRDIATEIDRWYAEQFAYLVSSLDALDAGDGTSLLDHTMIVWVNEQEKGIDNTHSWNRMPFIVAGSGGGYFRTGRHVTIDAPHANLYVDVMQAMGMPDTTFGEPDLCTGPISGLT